MPLNVPLDLSDVLDLLPDLVCVVGPDGTFAFVNSACEGLLAYRREDMVGRLMLDFVHPDDRQRTLEVARSVVAGQAQPGFENRWLRKDGSVVRLSWTARWSERHHLRIAVARELPALKPQP
jgi:PAS domain S-box-containing protein